MLAIDLLGEPQLRRGGAPLAITRRKSRALLYFLAAHDLPVSRDQLLAVLWPDLERAAAQQTLRTTLHGLRRALGPDLLAEDDRLALGPEVTVDVRRFESSLAAAGALSLQDLQAALDLYHGDFLAGFGLADAPAFDDWVAAQREHYRQLAVRGLARLAARHEAAGDFSAALRALDRALTLDALQEDVQRAALRLHYLAGDRAGAIRRYDRLRRLLDDELGVPPMAETRAVYDAILNDTLAPPAPEAARIPAPTAPAATTPLTPIPFAGRAAELAQLQALLAADTASTRPLVLIEGEPGIGKTRLAEEFLAAAGALALAGAARELEQNLPYQPIIEALRRLLAHPAWPALRGGLLLQPDGLAPLWRAEAARLLPELLPEAPPSAAAPDEPRLWEGVYQFLRALARQQPVLLFLDDAQWADASSLALLNFLHRRARTEAAPLLFLAAARPSPESAALAAFRNALTREARLLRLPLNRLEPEAVASLARQWAAVRGGASEDADALAEWLVAASEGNPYVLVELLRQACGQGLLAEDGTLALQSLRAAPLVPHSLYSLIQSRLARLSDPARRMLDAAVAAGRVFAFEVVYRAAGLSEPAGLDALDELRAAAIIQPSPPAAAEREAGPPLTRLAFDHSLTMEVAYREAGEPRHRRMHRRVAEALEQLYGRAGADPIAGVLAFHFFEGNEPERAAPYAARAGQQAARLAAWAEAVSFFEQALPATPSPVERQALAHQLGAAHFAAGHIDQAAEAFSLALALARDLEDDDRIEAAALELARTHLSQARHAEVRRLAAQVLAAQPSPASAASAEFLIGTSYSLEGIDLAQAVAHLLQAERHIGAAAAQGLIDAGRLATVKFELGSVAAQRGDLEAAAALYREAIAIAEQSSDPEAQPFAVLGRNNLAYHLHLLAPGSAEAQAIAEAGLQLARSGGLLGLLPYLYSTLGEIALGRGDVAAAEQHFTAGLALAEQQPLPERVAGLTANLGLAALARGEPALALHRLSAAMAHADALGTHHLAAQIRLWLAPLLPLTEARARLAEALAFARAGGRTRLLAEAEAVQQRLDAR